MTNTKEYTQILQGHSYKVCSFILQSFFSFGSLIQVLGICAIIPQQLVAMLQAHLRFLY